MTLHPTPDFADGLLATAQALHLPEDFVEKGYWVTTVRGPCRIPSTGKPLCSKGVPCCRKPTAWYSAFPKTWTWP